MYLRGYSKSNSFTICHGLRCTHFNISLIMSSSFVQLLKSSNAYSIYVLFILLLAYLLNQLDRYALGVTSKPMAQDIHFGDKGCMVINSTFSSDSKLCRYEKGSTTELDRSETSCLRKNISSGQHICKFDYDGTGSQYQILAGPAFIVVYTISGVPLGLLGDRFKRKYVLASCLLLWSTMTFLTGFAKSYWQLVLTRFVTGIGEAGCTPFAASLLGDYFANDLKASALGVYNWGIYIGYSMSYALGNFVVDANINNQGWRWVYFIAGVPGMILSAVVLFSVKEPTKKTDGKEDKSVQRGLTETIKLLAIAFFSPSSIILFLGGAIRNAGGYVWAYNTQPYFNSYYPDVNVGEYMSWIPLVGGSLGVVLGGLISDKIVKKRGQHARIWVLIVSQLVAAPFAAGALFLEPPWAFISLLPANIIGEMWIGVIIAVVIELVPSSVRTASLAWYLFVISIIGGNVPLLVPPLKKATNLRTALYILYPGLYVLSSVIFFLSLFVLKWDMKRKARLEEKFNALEAPGDDRKPIMGDVDDPEV